MLSSLTGSLLSPTDGKGTGTAPPQQSNPYSCNICGKTYGRLDHLSRHVRSHTKEKPFTCPVCGKAFTRADLLKRHEANHDTNGSNKRIKTSDPTRTRVAKACINCSESKLRCEGTYPCPRCQQKNLECQYRSTNKNGQPGSQLNEQADTGNISDLQMPNAPNDGQVFNAMESATISPRRESYVQRLSIDQGHPQNMLQHQLTPPQSAENEPKLFSDPLTFENPYMFNNAPSTEDTSSTDPFGEPGGLANFLRDVMVPELGETDVNAPIPASWDVLDFAAVDSWQTFFEDSSNLPPTATVQFEDQAQGERSGHATPMARTGMALSEQAWKTSPWYFVPASYDRYGANQANLLIPMNDLVEQTAVSKPLCPPLTAVARDRVLATVLATCESAAIDRVVTSFPTAELLSNLMHKWLEFHQAQSSTWLHIPTFDPNEEIPEMLLNTIAAGATLSHFPQIRKLSLALLEASRISNSNLFEKDNRNIRHLRPLQCTTIQLEATLWNGGRRLMEISESFSQPPITMLRRGGRFQHPTATPVVPDPSDDPAELEVKWRSWIEQESYKRLVFAVFERDVQTSMSLLNPPMISCSELSLPLPLSRDLWHARTAEEWRQIYIPKYPLLNQIPSFRQYLELFLSNVVPSIIDLDLSLLVWLYGHWTLAWNYRQWSSVARHSLGGTGKGKNLVVSSLQQETIKHLERYQIETFEIEGMKPVTALTYQRLLMNMHSSLEDLQLLAGKSGQEEAKKVYSLLTSWAQGREARQAVYHAGQLLQAAKSFPIGMLQHSNAVACYHAGLVLWGFSVVSKAILGGNAAAAAAGVLTANHTEYVLIDGENDARMQRFIVLGKGIPAICPYNANAHAKANNIGVGGAFSPQPQPLQQQQHQAVSVFDTRGVMRVVVHLLRAKNLYKDEEAPPLIDNLSKLLRSLGRAAQSM